MSDIRIIVKNADGSCKIIIPTDEFLETHTIHDVIARNKEVGQIDKDAVEGTHYRISDINALPTDREFRNAWTDDFPTSTVDIDIQKAKDIALTKLRADRQNLFVALGVPYQLAPTLEAAVLPQSTRDKLQRLRDCTNTLKAVNKTGKASTDDITQLKTLRDALQNKTIDQL